jgi:hypothetical protein
MLGWWKLKSSLRSLKDSDPQTRAKAAKALGELNDRGAVQGLSEALSDSDYFVLVAGIEALGAMPDPAAIPALAALVTRPGLPHVLGLESAAERAVDFLAKMGGDDVLPALRDAMSREPERARASRAGVEDVWRQSVASARRSAVGACRPGGRRRGFGARRDRLEAGRCGPARPLRDCGEALGPRPGRRRRRGRPAHRRA